MPDPMSMGELKTLIEGIHSNSPQRLQMAKTHLDALSQALKGLEAMGQKLAFTLLPPPEPIQYPKMLYKTLGKKQLHKIANNSMEETLLMEMGYFPPEPKPQDPEPEKVPVEEPPTFSVVIGDRHGDR